MFLKPLHAAAYRGHIDIVRFLAVDDSGGAPDLRGRPNLIISFAMLNDHTELLDFALDPSWHRGQLTPGDIHKLRLLGLKLTSKLGTFVRLLEDAKPHIVEYKPKWLFVRSDIAATKGQADILKYLIEKEGADVDDKHNETSLLHSRCPAEFVKGWMLQGRDHTLIGRAARAGYVDVVKVLLDAKAKHDHAIEFAVMCGSRTIVRLLWEHGENEDDAVQGAFAMAVDREDTAMYNLLEELGAKLADDVRAAVIKKAQEEGLESMVALLSGNTIASSGEAA
jgi:hypothetical protein